MKLLHRADLFGWSRFDEARNIDFHSVLWQREGGAVVIDPLPLSDHDARHARELGGIALIIVTNSDHVRDAIGVARAFGARVSGPRAERAAFPIPCDAWLAEGDTPVPGLEVLELAGSKTPGELALVLDQITLITGDLVRSHRGGELHLLPDAKLADKARALGSVRRLAERGGIDTVLCGDGWPIFRGGQRALEDLARSFR